MDDQITDRANRLHRLIHAVKGFIGNQPMKYRKLRVAWSVGSGVVALLLCGLWVRSYWSIDTLEGPLSRRICFTAESRPGEMIFGLYGTGLERWEVHSYTPAKGWSNGNWRFSSGPPWPYGWVLIPYAVLIVFAVFIAIAPWIRWSSHFSLRTLLIATTLVAVVLGVVVWALRK